jgi:hypothetical protein
VAHNGGSSSGGGGGWKEGGGGGGRLMVRPRFKKATRNTLILRDVPDGVDAEVSWSLPLPASPTSLLRPPHVNVPIR